MLWTGLPYQSLLHHQRLPNRVAARLSFPLPAEKAGLNRSGTNDAIALAVFRPLFPASGHSADTASIHELVRKFRPGLIPVGSPTGATTQQASNALYLHPMQSKLNRVRRLPNVVRREVLSLCLMHIHRLRALLHQFRYRPRPLDKLVVFGVPAPGATSAAQEEASAPSRRVKTRR